MSPCRRGPAVLRIHYHEMSYQAALRQAVSVLMRTFATMIALLLLVAMVSYARMHPAQSSGMQPAPSSVSNPFTIVAIGDSYMSGEGAATFYDGTDDPHTNTCRRAPTAYPVRVAKALQPPPPFEDVQLVFAACSGARTVNVGDNFTVPGMVARPQPGTELQIEAVRRHPDADVVLVSIGGNDAGFAEIIQRCAGRQGSCVPLAQEWLQHLDLVLQPQLRAVYEQVVTLAPSAEVYTTTYPNPFGSPECRDIGFDRTETAFVGDVFIPRLNEQISFAAAVEGLEVIDLADTFRGEGLCARGGGRHGRAVNAFRWQRTGRVITRPSEWVRGSMHPTEFGHMLMADKVLDQIRSDLVRQTPKEAPPGPPPFAGPPPPGLGLGDGPPGPPPFEGNLVGTPEGPWPLAPNPCASEATRRDLRVAPGGPVALSGVASSSRVCFQKFSGPWSSLVASRGGGRVTVPFDDDTVAGVAGWRNIVHQDNDGEVVWTTLLPDEAARPGELSMFRAWIGLRADPLRNLFIMLVVGSLSLNIAWAVWRGRRQSKAN